MTFNFMTFLDPVKTDGNRGLNVDVAKEWKQEYNRLGRLYAIWGSVFLILGNPMCMIQEGKLLIQDHNFWIFMRLMPSIVVAISLFIFIRTKYNHEILFCIVGYTLFIDYAYWPTCDNTKNFIINALTAFIPIALITMLRPGLFIINFFIQFILFTIGFRLSCGKEWPDFFNNEVFVPVFIAGISSYSVAILRYVAMKRNFMNRLLLKSALLEAESERKKSDELLLNILPEEVATELKTTGKSDARLYNHVTVLFTDFVNFTGISANMKPQELVSEINKNFTAFDTIVEKYGLEKIKTIGDAYLAVCGLPHEQADHAQRVVAASLEMIQFLDQNAHKFQIRIGINTGPVVAGIVGVKKYAYDIWGDTVNTAARMEQNSETGKINISGSTYDLVKNDFNCEPRGKIEAKNKGEIDMYFVNGAV